jgi:hypothetical protein
MSTIKMCGWTGAALFCVSLAQPARAAADCPADRAQGDEKVVGSAAPNADQRETPLADPFGFTAQTSMPAAVGTHDGLPADRVTGAPGPDLLPSGCFEVPWPPEYCCCFPLVGCACTLM